MERSVLDYYVQEIDEDNNWTCRFLKIKSVRFDEKGSTLVDVEEDSCIFEAAVLNVHLWRQLGILNPFDIARLEQLKERITPEAQ